MTAFLIVLLFLQAACEIGALFGLVTGYPSVTERLLAMFLFVVLIANIVAIVLLFNR